jgi:trehalose/maltose transport system substrate-binding protein
MIFRRAIGALTVALLGALLGAAAPAAWSPAGAASLTVVCGSSPPEVELCRQGGEAWAAARGHEVRVLGYPESGARARALLAELLEAGVTDLDVLEIDGVWPELLAPHLVDLTDRLGTAGPFFAAADRSFRVDGRLVAVPWSSSVGRLLYRKDLLERYRLPVPSTWEELAASARQIQDGERAAGRDGFWGYVWQGRPGEGLTVNAVEWLASRGAPPILAQDGSVAVDRPEAAVALEAAASWVDAISPGAVLEMDDRRSLEAFTAGDAAFLRHWSSGLPLTEVEGSAVRGRVAMAELPAGEGLAGRHAGVLGGSGLAVARGSKVPDLAVDLVLWLAGPAEQKRRALAGGFDPSLPALYGEAELVATRPHLPALRPALEGATLRPAGVAAAAGGYDALSATFAEGVRGILTREVEAGPGLKALGGALRRLGTAAGQRAGS